MEKLHEVMESFHGTLETFFYDIINYIILLVEIVGVAILVYAVVRAVVGLFTQAKHLRLDLAEGIALSLEFKMGGELLRTVVAREMSEILVLGAVILLRAALTFLIQWEIKLEKQNGGLLNGDIDNSKKKDK